MNVIAMGYMGTGSSAIHHLLTEYENVSLAGPVGYEHVVFYMPHGLFDLEVTLLNNNLLFKSDAALNDFYDAMKRINDGNFGWFGSFKRLFGNQFMENVDEFMEGLINYSRKDANWFNDYRWERTAGGVAKDSIKKLLRRNVDKLGYRSRIVGDNRINYSFPTEDEFYLLARKFVSKYMKMFTNEKDKVFVFDQLLKPQNLCKFTNYFESDTKCIVFSRDIRDMYISSKYVWSRMTGRIILPDTPEEFVNFYSRFLKTEKMIEDSRILRMNFEDLVYFYQASVEIIESFLGKELLGKHIAPQLHFKPDVSIKNTQVFRINPEFETEASYISDMMPERIYRFPYVIHPKIEETSDPA